MQSLHKKVLALMAGTSITAKSHPVLVSLLQMAGQGAGLGRKAPAAAKQQQARAWGKVVAAFKHAAACGITDEKLRAAMPFPGLLFTDEGGWQITAPVPLVYRDLVAAALDAVANASYGLKPQEFHNLEGLRDARRRNRLPPIEAVLPAEGRIDGQMLPGRRIIVSRMHYGRRVHSLLQADEFGRLHALTHERSILNCQKFHDKNPPKS